MVESDPEIFEKVVEKIYEDDDGVIEQLSSTVRVLESRYLNSGVIEVTPDLLQVILLKPSITRQLHMANAKTMTGFFMGVLTNDLATLKERAFNVHVRPNREVFASAEHQKPELEDLETSEVADPHDYAKDSEDSLIVATTHTHPSFSNILVPSVIVRSPTGLFIGDLFSFQLTRDLGMKAEIIERPLQLISQHSLDGRFVQMLFIMESVELTRMQSFDYAKKLFQMRDSITETSDQSTVVNKLRDLGYKVSFLQTDLSYFYGYPISDYEQVEKISEDLGLTR